MTESSSELVYECPYCGVPKPISKFHEYFDGCLDCSEVWRQCPKHGRLHPDEKCSCPKKQSSEPRTFEVAGRRGRAPGRSWVATDGGGMMFTDQKPHVVTAKDLTRPWGGARDGSRFRCYLCGHRFTEGDAYRWVYSNGTPGAGGNPMVCSGCDGPNDEVIARWKAMHQEARERFWWFTTWDGA